MLGREPHIHHASLSHVHRLALLAEDRTLRTRHKASDGTAALQPLAACNVCGAIAFRPPVELVDTARAKPVRNASVGSV